MSTGTLCNPAGDFEIINASSEEKHQSFAPEYPWQCSNCGLFLPLRSSRVEFHRHIGEFGYWFDGWFGIWVCKRCKGETVQGLDSD